MEIIASWFLYFIAYSVLGWVAETIYCSVPKGHFVERGFLRGPLCPIYGAGAIIILIALEPYVNNIPLIFILGMMLTSALEYITSVLMEKLFHMRWWDYSNHLFQLNGRICLLNSTLFGLLCVVLTEFIHPFIQSVAHRIPDLVLFLTTSIICAVFIADVIVSVRAILQLKGHLEKLRKAEEQLRIHIEEQREKLKEQLEISADQLKTRLDESGKEIKEQLETGKIRYKEAREQHAEHLQSGKDELKEFLQKQSAKLSGGEKYLLRSFPRMKPINHKLETAMERYRTILKKERMERKEKKKK